MHIGAVRGRRPSDVDVRQAARALAPTATVAPAAADRRQPRSTAPPRSAVWIVGAADRLRRRRAARDRGLAALARALRRAPRPDRDHRARRVDRRDRRRRRGDRARRRRAARRPRSASSLAAALWWVYFDDALERSSERLHAVPAGRARNVMARDAFSFLHLPLVAGIVLLALGVKKTLEHVDDPLKDVAAVGAVRRRRALPRRRRRVPAPLPGTRRARSGSSPRPPASRCCRSRPSVAGARRARGRRRDLRRARRLRVARA